MILNNVLVEDSTSTKLLDDEYSAQREQVLARLKEFSERALMAHEKAYESVVDEQFERLDDVKSILRNYEHEANELDNAILSLLSHYDVEPKELRGLVSGLKIINELVRTCDDARTYAKNMKEANGEGVDLSDVLEYAIKMHEYAIVSLKTAICAMQGIGRVEQEENLEELFVKAKIEESKTDDLYKVLEKDILNKIKEEKELSSKFVKILSTIRKLERTADHAVNIASLVLYVKRGGKLKSY